jgi:predicted esterase YcpF (UPF0227 family)
MSSNRPYKILCLHGIASQGNNHIAIHLSSEFEVTAPTLSPNPAEAEEEVANLLLEQSFDAIVAHSIGCLYVRSVVNTPVIAINPPVKTSDLLTNRKRLPDFRYSPPRMIKIPETSTNTITSLLDKNYLFRGIALLAKHDQLIDYSKYIHKFHKSIDIVYIDSDHNVGDATSLVYLTNLVTSLVACSCDLTILPIGYSTLESKMGWENDVVNTNVLEIPVNRQERDLFLGSLKTRLIGELRLYSSAYVQLSSILPTLKYDSLVLVNPFLGLGVTNYIANVPTSYLQRTGKAFHRIEIHTQPDVILSSRNQGDITQACFFNANVQVMDHVTHELPKLSIICAGR